MLAEGENLSVSHERLTGSEMEELMIRLGRPTVIDATHPYAAVVTENIQTACRRTDTPYLRLVRRETELSDRDVIWKDDSPGGRGLSGDAGGENPGSDRQQGAGGVYQAYGLSGAGLCQSSVAGQCSVFLPGTGV